MQEQQQQSQRRPGLQPDLLGQQRPTRVRLAMSDPQVRKREQQRATTEGLNVMARPTMDGHRAAFDHGISATARLLVALISARECRNLVYRAREQHAGHREMESNRRRSSSRSNAVRTGDNDGDVRHAVHVARRGSGRRESDGRTRRFVVVRDTAADGRGVVYRVTRDTRPLVMLNNASAPKASSATAVGLSPSTLQQAKAHDRSILSQLLDVMEERYGMQGVGDCTAVIRHPTNDSLFASPLPHESILRGGYGLHVAPPDAPRYKVEMHF